MGAKLASQLPLKIYLCPTRCCASAHQRTTSAPRLDVVLSGNARTRRNLTDTLAKNYLAQRFNYNLHNSCIGKYRRTQSTPSISPSSLAGISPFALPGHPKSHAEQTCNYGNCMAPRGLPSKFNLRAQQPITPPKAEFTSTNPSRLRMQNRYPSWVRVQPAPTRTIPHKRVALQNIPPFRRGNSNKQYAYSPNAPFRLCKCTHLIPHRLRGIPRFVNTRFCSVVSL